MRKRIETVFSQITSIFPRSINAVTSKGFEIKPRVVRKTPVTGKFGYLDFFWKAEGKLL